MKIQLGYVAISKTLEPLTTSTPYKVTDFNTEQDYQKLSNIIEKNLKNLLEILKYNEKNQIHFYRLTSNLIPLATYEKANFNYITPYQELYQSLANQIKKSNIRIDMHPNQYCLLNSAKKEVIESSIEILKYHYQILSALKIKNKIIILHIGSNTFGKKNSLARFIHQFKLLPKYLQKIIAIENDDKTFNIEDCLYLSHILQIPVVLDYHHFQCNPPKKEITEYLEAIFKSWEWIGIRPKIHFSSPKNKREYRAHNDYIDADNFIEFLSILKNYPYDIDIMLEAKAKDEALFRLIRALKYKTNIEFLDETSFKI